MNKFHRLAGVLRQWLRTPYFGFVQGHAYLSPHDVGQIRSHIGKPARGIVDEFERGFASLVGEGRATSFAAGRMGFYVLMKILGIGTGDEVIVQGATCAVMVNAILRTGATPVFADIDPETFGSSAQHIERCITPRSRMIVAQHSFGIPCDVEPIVALTHSRNIFLLEDSALAIGSTIDGIAVGNFGDAALFSTDHSKPLNTLTGGLVYTRDSYLANKLQEAQADSPDLPDSKQQALWQRFLLERRYCHPSKYGRMGVIDLLAAVRSKSFKRVGPFLSEDFRATTNSSYPYPARLPGFLAAIGLHEVARWPRVAADRKGLLRGLLEVAMSSEMNPCLPKAYLNRRLDIVPLRFAWSQPDGALVRERLSRFMNVDWTWFLCPIIATAEPLESFGYNRGSCPVSEKIGGGMVNLPCNVSRDDSNNLVSLFRKILSLKTN
jgi:dTDP-4-amino-4,6-dideoxygalactose transaminase